MVCGCLVVVGGAKLVVDDIGVTPAALGQDARPSSPQNPRCGRVGVEEDEGQDEDEGQAGSRPERKLERAGPQHEGCRPLFFKATTRGDGPTTATATTKLGQTANNESSDRCQTSQRSPRRRRTSWTNRRAIRTSVPTLCWHGSSAVCRRRNESQSAGKSRGRCP